jgi:hypothetical protein
MRRNSQTIEHVYGEILLQIKCADRLQTKILLLPFFSFFIDNTMNTKSNRFTNKYYFVLVVVV